MKSGPDVGPGPDSATFMKVDRTFSGSRRLQENRIRGFLARKGSTRRLSPPLNQKSLATVDCREAFLIEGVPPACGGAAVAASSGATVSRDLLPSVLTDGGHRDRLTRRVLLGSPIVETCGSFSGVARSGRSSADRYRATFPGGWSRAHGTRVAFPSIGRGYSMLHAGPSKRVSRVRCQPSALWNSAQQHSERKRPDVPATIRTEVTASSAKPAQAWIGLGDDAAAPV